MYGKPIPVLQALVFIILMIGLAYCAHTALTTDYGPICDGTTPERSWCHEERK